MMKLIGVGDNVCDKYRTLGTMFPGGQALNVAVYCKLNGWNSGYLGAFGRDAVGGHVQRTLDALGVDRSRCRTYDGANGYAVVDLVDGDRVFISSNKGGVLREHPIQLTAEDLEYVSGFDVLHTSNNSYFDSQLQTVAQLPILVSYDFSGSWRDESRRKAVSPCLDLGFLSCSDLSEEEIQALLKELHRDGCGVAVATMGSRGAFAWDGYEMAVHRPALVEAVDTLGAGDSFAAGFIMRYCADRRAQPEVRPRLTECMESGAALSAKTCLVRGAFGYGAPIS